MRKSKVVFIGLFISLLVPVIHLITFEVSTSNKNSSESQSTHINFLRKAVEAGDISAGDLARISKGDFHIAYWYSYTIVDFMRDFAIALLVYTLVIFLIQAIRVKLRKT